jgi:hypothetical protein
MPRIVRSPETATPRRLAGLVEQLADELKSGRESGQPLIDEEHFKTGAVRVVVFWDRWDHISQEDRSEAILEAYRKVEGDDFANRIALVSGLTIPEGQEAGMLPWYVFPALREDDPATPEQCFQAMIDEGASVLRNPSWPELRFATEEEAEACKKRLANRLPGSEPCWVIVPEIRLGEGETWDFSGIE